MSKLRYVYIPPTKLTLLHVNNGESDLLAVCDFGGVACFASWLIRAVPRRESISKEPWN